MFVFWLAERSSRPRGQRDSAERRVWAASLAVLAGIAVLVGARRRRSRRDSSRPAGTQPPTPARIDHGPDLQPLGALDDITGHRATKVTGWAVDPRAPVDRIEIEVTSHRPVRARLGLIRDDALALTGVAHARVSGFEGLIDLSGVHGPSISITARAYTSHGASFVVAERTVVLDTATERFTPPRSPDGDELQEPIQALPRPAAAAEAHNELDLLVFAHDLNRGGAQMWLRELLERSGAGRQYPCTVIASGPGPDGPRLEALGIRVHVTDPCPVWDVELYEKALAELAALTADAGHTAVLVNTFVSLIGADLAGRLGLPYVWALHESYEPSMIMPALYSPDTVDPLVQAAAMLALRSASRTVFVAEATRRLFLDYVDPAHAVVVPYGVDTAAIDATRAGISREAARLQLSLSHGETVLLCVGTIEPRKAQTTTAAAFARIADEYPDTLLVFVGAIDRPYTDGLRQFVADAGLADRCLVVPVLADPSLWYLSADVLVSASDVESLPRTVLEAMCFEVPVLATSVFGVPELITDGVTGWLFEPRSVAAAEKALRRVLDTDVATRRAVAAAGSALVHDRYDSNGYVSALSSMLRSLASEPRHAPDGFANCKD
jgi:glycosyltransferase involved in cell wall biosynthesis